MSLWGTGGSLISGVPINNNFYLVWGYDRSVFWHVSTVQQLSRSVGAPLIMSLISVTHTHGGALRKLYHLMLQCCNFSDGSHPMGCIHVSSTASHPARPIAYICLPLQLTRELMDLWVPQNLFITQDLFITCMGLIIPKNQNLVMSKTFNFRTV